MKAVQKVPNEPKLHHFLPEAYLRRFTDEHGNIWVLDRMRGVVRRQSPEVTAAERELYTLDDGRGERDRRVESALANYVDGPGQHAIRVLHDGGRLSNEDAGKLATFVAALSVRTPAFREQLRQMAEQMRDSLFRGGVEPCKSRSRGVPARRQNSWTAAGVHSICGAKDELAKATRSSYLSLMLIFDDATPNGPCNF